MNSVNFIRCLSVLLLAISSFQGLAQEYPSKPVKFIVPASPGGLTDVLARQFGMRLSEMWSQPVIVENRPGAGQIIGTDAVAKSPSDGYTFLVTDSSAVVINPHLYSKLPYDPVRDLTPVAVFAQISPVIAVNASVPASNMQELIALAKAKPRGLAYGSFGSGTYAHIAMERLKQLADVDIVHVPYKGSSPAMTDLLAGHIQVILVSLSVVEPQARAGKVRILAATTPKRVAAAPDLPTVAEAAVPGFETTSWFGLLGPANLPRQVVAKVHADVQRVIKTPGFLEQNYKKFGLEPVPVSPQEFRQLVETDLDKWGRMVKATGAKID
jgi:tripartite-type tricarboxylate transporter receptor subunit TctC